MSSAAPGRPRSPGPFLAIVFGVALLVIVGILIATRKRLDSGGT